MNAPMQMRKTDIRTVRDLRSSKPEELSELIKPISASEFPASFELRHSSSGVFLLLLSVLSLPHSTTLAQPYSIDWYTIDDGGGTSTGGVHSISGTIGQPEAGATMTNGQYAVTGGFWVLPVAVQTEGAPTLTIVKGAPGLATVSWTPNTGTNWVLQEGLSLSSDGWSDSPSGFTNPASVPATVPAKLYRLFKP